MTMIEATVSRGRPRKSNVMRDASGKSRGERDIDVTTLGTWAHRSRLVGRQEASHPDAGFTLGLCRLNKEITTGQYDAGNAWAELCHRHAKIMGYSLGSPKSPSFMMVSFGTSTATESDQIQILKIREKWKNCYDALAEVSRGNEMRVSNTTYAVCVQGIPFEGLGPRQFGDLRVGLNALGRVLK